MRVYVTESLTGLCGASLNNARVARTIETAVNNLVGNVEPDSLREYAKNLGWARLSKGNDFTFGACRIISVEVDE
jgi:hypothetical protein